MTERIAQVTRNTRETRIEVTLNLDGTGTCHFDTGVPFLEHMMEQIGRHGVMDLDIKANGDLHIDDHHTVEDIGITIGQAIHKALGDRQGICATVSKSTADGAIDVAKSYLKNPLGG